MPLPGGKDSLLVASSIAIAMAAAGWNWAKAAEYRRKTASLEGRERELATDLARVERESRSPRLFPPRVYQLTRTMLDCAARGQLDRLDALIRAGNQKTCQLVLDQCVAVADCIVNGRSAAWPPSEADLRMIAAITSSSMENRPWQGHLELIWKLETDDGVNCSALRAAERRFRRASVTSTSEDDS
jgi:hypothetical protein